MLSLIPISDVNPTRRTPYVTIGLVAANMIMFFMTPGLGQTQASNRYFVEHAPAPCELVERCTSAIPHPDSTIEVLFAILVAMFLHAGWFHIIGNLLFLWVFGNNVEDHLGHLKYLLFYLAGGFAAAFAHIYTHLDSVAPLVGASGAVAAVMGAYLVLYPKARVNVLVPIIFIFTIIQMSAVIVLGVWFLYQFLIGTQELAGEGGVAWMAHVGGFAFGVIGVFLLGGRPHPPVYHNPYPSWR
ncbi:MAG: rhomboid family intramembrane serine protease [Actinobacteria bacterium]|nr:rhomboid family intramembrane serine protease [Actinomycetota bacterium]